MRCHERGYFLDARENDHFDRSLADALVVFLKNESAATVLDLGCGNGKYVKHFRANGIGSDGYDGNPATPEMTGGQCHCADLSRPISVKRRDWVLSLEVGEHIPQEYETVFFDNLDLNNRKGIILSWAFPGQGGIGHVNERETDYVIERLSERGYRYDEESSSTLRNEASLHWFQKTTMVFRR